MNKFELFYFNKISKIKKIKFKFNVFDFFLNVQKLTLQILTRGVHIWQCGIILPLTHCNKEWKQNLHDAIFYDQSNLEQKYENKNTTISLFIN